MLDAKHDLMDLPSSGEKRIAETAIYWGSAGGGVAIILTP